MSQFVPTPHPVLALPSMAEAMALGSEGFGKLMARREEIIRREKADPFGSGWEPPIWRVCDALCGFPWVEAKLAAELRADLGFAEPVKTVLVMGGNRGAKTTWASKTVMRVLRWRQAAKAWAFHMSMQMSIDYHQPLFWHWMDPALKGKDIRTQKTYIAYKQKTGFSEANFVLPTGSACAFQSYEADVDNIEGGNLDLVWPDELVPPDWIATLELRVAEKDGWLIVTFTPKRGYSPTVQLFQDGAVTVREVPAFMLPLDGGPPDRARALGLSAEELAECEAALREKRASRSPQSRPAPLALEPMGDRKLGEPFEVDGRLFAAVPRVMKCAKSGRAIVFFHSSDNPFGNPQSVLRKLEGTSAEYVKERFYGFTERTMTARFPKFRLDVHVVAPDSIPKAGTNYHKVDPSSGRNFAMLWFRVTPENVFVYREWPGSYVIDGVGLPGPWAVPDGKKLDGKMGPAQSPFGFGNIRYKLELARLEGWRDWEKDKARMADGGWRMDRNLNDSTRRIIAEWDELNGAREVMASREIDSRFASVPKNENDRPSTLLTDLEDIKLFFQPAPAGEIAEGVQKINDALYYNEDQPVDFFNKPRLLISSECENLIYALRTWTGQDGQKGATKDFIEILYWMFTGDNPYAGSLRSATGGEDGEEEDANNAEDWGGKAQRHY